MAERSVERLRSEARDPKLDELGERVSDRFRSLGATAGTLQAKVRAASDWRGVARRHPGWLLGTVAGVAGAGLVTATVLRRSRRPSTEQKVEAALGWLSSLPFGPRKPTRSVASIGAPMVRGAFGFLASVMVRRFSRRLRDEILRAGLRSRPRLVGEPRVRARL